MPRWVTVFLTIWAVIGPIVGIVAGNFLTRSSQRSQWLADNKKAEFREAQTALSVAYLALAELAAMTLREGIEEKRVWQIVADSYRILRDRIFIAEDIKREKLLDLWTNATQAFDHGDIGISELNKRYDAINDKIVELATSLRP